MSTMTGRDSTTATRVRERLVTATSLAERRETLAGLTTAILEGGSGPPMILLHGQGEHFGVWLQCFVDFDAVGRCYGDHWDELRAYALDRARTSTTQAALRWLMPRVGVAPIPADDLARITVPTTLIHGRHDLQVPLVRPSGRASGTGGRCASSRAPATTRPPNRPRRSSPRCTSPWP